MKAIEIWGHLAFVLVMFMVLPSGRLAKIPRLLLLPALTAVSFVQIDGLTLGDFAASYADELAVSTMVLLGWCCLARLRGVPFMPIRHHTRLALIFALAGLVLYPATLGLSGLDPYRWGYAPQWLMVGTLILSLALWWWKNYLSLTLVVISTAAYSLDVKSSDNYWDYLIDPLLWLYCCVFLVRRAWQHWPRGALREQVQ